MMDMEHAIQELEYTRDKMIEAATAVANQWLEDTKKMFSAGIVPKTPLIAHARWAIDQLGSKAFTARDIRVLLSERFPITTPCRKANLSATLRNLTFHYKELVVLKVGIGPTPSVYQAAKKAKK